METEVETGKVNFREHRRPFQRHMLQPAVAWQHGLSDGYQCLEVLLERQKRQLPLPARCICTENEVTIKNYDFPFKNRHC